MTLHSGMALLELHSVAGSLGEPDTDFCVKCASFEDAWSG